MSDVSVESKIDPYIGVIAKDLNIRENQVRQTAELLALGGTVPFIARYRKEQTGMLDEEQIRGVEEKVEYFSQLEERKTTVLKSIEEQGKLTPALKEQILKAESKVTLEDLYAPYKQKRKTRATVAKDAGLEPLARQIAEQKATDSLEELAKPFISEEKGIRDEKAAIQGAMDILAEELSEQVEYKAYIRDREQKSAAISSEVKKKFEGQRSKFEMYYSFQEKIGALPSHRVLALRRGEKEGVLKTTIHMDDEHNATFLQGKVLTEKSPFQAELAKMAEDAYHRLLKPSIESELRLQLKKDADSAAIEVFRKNLKDVLLAPPAGQKTIMGVDPGFKSGTKIAIIDKNGTFVQQHTIYPLPPQSEGEASKTIIQAMVDKFQVELIAIGNGTASREIDQFVANTVSGLENSPIKLVVSEAGASVYSASPLARQEFPDLDVTIRGAISIARRVQDPLAELVKIEPKSIGVGQYQHDVNQTELKKKLEQVVESCVNSVGVDVNTASEPLLSHVAGITKSLAKSIVKYREANGSFVSRASLVKVPHFGPKAFEQAAGFLRIYNGENPLDGTAVHPERYDLVTQISEKVSVDVQELVNNKEAVGKISLEEFVTEAVGLPTLEDIRAELERPSRDPRKKFAYAKFNPDIKEVKDLQEGSWMEGIVTNVTDFGVFVDLGVHQDGLIHVSELADRFVSDATQVLSTGDIVKVRVLAVDVEQKRISLSMKKEGGSTGGAGRSGKRKQGNKKRKPATLDQLKNKFESKGKNQKNNVKLKFSLKSIMKSGR
jgi:uncharacterized protein